MPGIAPDRRRFHDRRRTSIAADPLDVFRRSESRAAALAEVKARIGTWFDPAVADAFARVAVSDAFRAILSAPEIDEAVRRLEPRPAVIVVDGDDLDDIARALAQVIDAKSPFTAGHSERVAVYADMIASELGRCPDDRRWLKRAALLHDIGKLGVSNAILDKRGPLDDAEWKAMRGHAAMSESILQRVPALAAMARIGGAHHERLDGKGYPRGLSGTAIDMETRIVSVADVFDALTAHRPCRAAMGIETTLAVMRRDVGAAFDPDCFASLEQALSGIENDLARAA